MVRSQSRLHVLLPPQVTSTIISSTWHIEKVLRQWAHIHMYSKMTCPAIFIQVSFAVYYLYQQKVVKSWMYPEWFFCVASHHLDLIIFFDPGKKWIKGGTKGWKKKNRKTDTGSFCENEAMAANLLHHCLSTASVCPWVSRCSKPATIAHMRATMCVCMTVVSNAYPHSAVRVRSQLFMG